MELTHDESMHIVASNLLDKSMEGKECNPGCGFEMDDQPIPMSVGYVRDIKNLLADSLITLQLSDREAVCRMVAKLISELAYAEKEFNNEHPNDGSTKSTGSYCIQ